MARKIHLSHRRAPGDSVVLTGLVRDIALAHPKKFRISVSTSAMDIWKHNPYIVPATGGRRAPMPAGTEQLKITYGKGIKEQNYEPVHFVSYFHRDFEKRTGVKVPLLYPKPDLHLSPEEANNRIIDGRYWLVISGGKTDFTAKVWKTDYFQETIDQLRKKGIRFVQTGSADRGHWHPPLNGVLDMVGKTNLRDLFRLIAQADGVICGITMAMHAAAAFDRPCVVIAGGREAWWWEAYVHENKGFGGNIREHLKNPHRFLHTIGLLDCCEQHGCWRNKVVKLHNDKQTCYYPIMHPGQAVPKCMDMITPEHVMEAVMGYYEDKSLPPIGQVEKKPTPKATEGVALIDLFADSPPTNGATTPATAPELTVKTPPAGRGPKHAGKRAAILPASPVMAADAKALFDHPTIGGKFTAFVLLYGPYKYHDLHRRCLDSLIATVPKGRMDLRIGSNALCPESVAYIMRLKEKGIVSTYYQHGSNDRKYPVMREMFYDPANPIDTKWILWFDDDTVCDRDPQWLPILTRHIIEYYPKNNHMFGGKYVWTMNQDQIEAFKSRPWYKERAFRAKGGKEAPNGRHIIFATGGFWALSTHAMRACNIPDPDLGHNGGDYTIGEQLWQGGFGLKAFNGKKQFVRTSSVPRRGLDETHFGMKK